MMLLLFMLLILSRSEAWLGQGLLPSTTRNSKYFIAKQLKLNDHKIYAPIPVSSCKTVEEANQGYQEQYRQSIENPAAFWQTEANKYLTWQKDFTATLKAEFPNGSSKWFEDGQINACYNAVDRHALTKGDQAAIIWEGDEPGQSRTITYKELQVEVSRIANVMKARGVQKGDVVTIYMPMIPELAMVMLACARIGAIHSVVFAGFSADALRDRINDCQSKWLFAADEGKRGGKTIKLKDAVDTAVSQCPGVDTVFVFKHTGGTVASKPQDLWMHTVLPQASTDCPIEPMNSEDPLFILYTSGSTGKPKGVLHTTAGYLLYAAMTTKNTFDLREKDILCCVADCGWITGHSYVVYGPLCNGATTVMFESIPTYPNPYRYWDLVQKTKATQFYTAPTAIRALMRYDAKPIEQFDLSSLRILGTVGEPINPEAWKWYYEHVGHAQCTVVDTYWQTETGGHIVSNLPGITTMKPGSCSQPYYGIDLAVLDATTGRELVGNNVEGVLAVKQPWPGMARTIYGDHDRYLNTYMKPYPGYYFTGDACRRDTEGAYWITGRVDDVINPSGHRIGTAELENILNTVPEVSESAVVGFPHDVKGEGIGCYVVLKEGFTASDALTQKMKDAVRKSIGPIATPDFIIYSDLPKTRSGKIMRRILRKIAAHEFEALGDTSTLADPSVVEKLIEKFKALNK